MNCLNFVCLNKVKGGLKWRHNFCLECRRSKEPYVIVCEICGVTFTPNSKVGQIPKVCSIECRVKRRSLIRSMEWKLGKISIIKRNKCNKCGHDYIINNKKHKGKLTHCSKKCYDKKEWVRIRLSRYNKNYKPAMLGVYI